MLRRLRFQLSLLYLLAAFSLVLLVGGGSYLLLRYYLQQTTDLALEYKMAQQFHNYGLALPKELRQAEISWMENNAHLTRGASGLITALPSPTRSLNGEEEDEEGEHAQPSAPEYGVEEDALDGDLTSIFVSPLNANGEVIAGSQASAAPLIQDKAASLAAM